MATTSKDPAAQSAADPKVAQIVQATRTVINEFGIRRATVGDIARAAGVSRQTVYDRFPSREALIGAALDAGARDLVVRGVERADQRGGSARDRLATLLSTGLEFAATSPLWATESKRAELVEHVTIDGRVFRAAAIAEIEIALAAWWPTVPDGPRRRAATMVARLLVSHGLAPEETSTSQVADELADLLTVGLDGMAS